MINPIKKYLYNRFVQLLAVFRRIYVTSSYYYNVHHITMEYKM